MIYFAFLFLKIPQILVKQFVSVHFTHNYYYYIYYLHVSSAAYVSRSQYFPALLYGDRILFALHCTKSLVEHSTGVLDVGGYCSIAHLLH